MYQLRLKRYLSIKFNSYLKYIVYIVNLSLHVLCNRINELKERISTFAKSRTFYYLEQNYHLFHRRKHLKHQIMFPIKFYIKPCIASQYYKFT